jgi:hypothetical protein
MTVAVGRLQITVALSTPRTSHTTAAPPPALSNAERALMRQSFSKTLGAARDRWMLGGNRWL